jgi:hypothetical protein
MTPDHANDPDWTGEYAKWVERFIAATPELDADRAQQLALLLLGALRTDKEQAS